MIIIDTEMSIPTESESTEGFYYINAIDTDILETKESPEEKNSNIDFVTRNSPSGTNILHKTNNHQYSRSTRVSIRNNSYQNIHNRSISPGNKITQVKASPNPIIRPNQHVPMNGQNHSKTIVNASSLPPPLDANFAPYNTDRYLNDLTPQVISCYNCF